LLVSPVQIYYSGGSGLDELPGDKHMSCNNKVCSAAYQLDFDKVKHTSSSQVASVQDAFLAECTAVLHGMASEKKYSPSCQKQLKKALCESTFTLSPM
jgi:hypothetical protein